jgi:hypothetical protein
MANVTETVMPVLTAVNVVIVAYTLVVDRAEKAAARAREWRARFYRFKEEIRANLRVIEAPEREDLNNNAIANPAIRALICQLRGVYLNSVPGMADSIKAGVETPVSACIPLSDVWPDV